MLFKSIVASLLILLFQQLPSRPITRAQRSQDVCQSENKRLTTENQTLRDQVSDLQARLGGLDRQLAEARQEVEKYKALADRSSRSSLELNSLQSKFNELSQQLQVYRDDNKRLLNLNTELKKQLDDPRRSRELSLLKSQLTEAQQQLEASNLRHSEQLKKLQADQVNLDLQLKTSNDAVQKFKTQNLQLADEMASLKLKLSGQENQLQTTESELQTSKASVSDLTKQLLNRGNAPSSPEALLALKFEEPPGGKSTAGIVSIYEDSGKVHVIRELVIGTLQTIYDKEVKPGRAFPLKAIFKPHPIITPGTLNQSASEENISWFIDLQYPSQKSQVVYDQQQSGQKPSRRAIDPRGGDETWIWSVLAPPNFESDISDLVVFAEYQRPTQTGTQTNRKDIVHENIKFNQIIEPGAFTRTISWIKENLTYLLATATAVIAIWGGIIKTKKDKLEMKLQEKEQAQTT